MSIIVRAEADRAVLQGLAGRDLLSIRDPAGDELQALLMALLGGDMTG